MVAALVVGVWSRGLVRSTTVSLRYLPRAPGGRWKVEGGNEPRPLLIFALDSYAIPFVCTANCTCIRDSLTAAPSFFFLSFRCFAFTSCEAARTVARSHLPASASHVCASRYICRLDKLDMSVPHAQPLHR